MRALIKRFTFILAISLAMSVTANAQSYRVEIYFSYMCGCTGFEIQNPTITVGGVSQTVSQLFIGTCGGGNLKIYDNTFTSSFSPSITISGTSICDDGCTPGPASTCTPCIGPKSETRSFSLSGSQACSNQTVQFNNLSCAAGGSTVVLSVVWTPVYSPSTNSSITLSGTDICEGDNLTLSTVTSYFGYVWKYKDQDLSSFQSLSVNPGPSGSISVSADKIYGSNYLSHLSIDNTVQFQYQLGSCPAVTTTTPVSFKPKKPNVGTSSVNQPACSYSTGSFSVNSLSRGPIPNEIYTVTLFNRTTNVATNITNLTSTSFPVSFNNLTPGAYEALVEGQVGTNPTGCGTPQYYPFTISQPSAVSFSASTASPSCNTNTTGTKNDGSITVSASGGTNTGFQYSSDGSSYQGSNVLSGLTTGSYAVRVKDSNGCLSDPQTIGVADAPDITLTSALVTSDYNGSQIKCAGESNGIITASASSARSLTYAIDGGTFTASAVFTGLSAGSHTVTVRDAVGCSKAFSPVSITAPSSLSVSLTPTAALCYNQPSGSVQVTSSSGGTGTRSFAIDGATFSSTTLFSSLLPGSYTVTVRDANSCTSTASTTVGNPAAIAVSATPSLVTCAGGADGTVTLSASNSVGTPQYSFNGGSFLSSNTFSGIAAGSYSYSVKDGNGCIGNGNVTVSSNPIITGTIAIASPVSCNGASDGALNLTPGGGVGPYSFAWSTGALSEDIVSLPAGTYTVTIKDSKNCSQNFSRSLTQPAAISATAALSDYNGFGVKCFGDANGAINLSPSGGNGGYTFVWSTGAVSEDLTGLAAGTYSVTITDSKMCTGVKSFIIDQPQVLVASVASSQNIACFGGATGSITLSAAGGTPAYTYSINNGSTYQSSPTFTSLPANAYTIRIRDLNGCSDTDAITLTAPPDLVLTIDNIGSTSCGQNNGSAAASASGGVSTYAFQWFNNANTLLASAPTITNVAAGIYRVVVTDQNTCSKQQTITISASNGPAITVASVSPASCHESADGSATISIAQGQAPYSIHWPGGESTNTLSGVLGGEYIVEVSDQSGCQVFQSVLIPRPDPLMINTLNQQDPNCTGNADGVIAIEAVGGNGGYAYGWSNNAVGSSLSGLLAGTYSVTVKDSKNCEAVKSITLTDPPVFVVNLGEDRKICEGQVLTVDAGIDNATYAWTGPGGFTSNQQQADVSLAGTYTCTVTSDKGCVDDDSFVLAYDTELLKADFLMVSQAFAGDTIVVIDISWPQPTLVNWIVDSRAVVIDQDDDLALIRFDEPGNYLMKLEASLATCASVYSASILILDRPEAPAGRTNTGGTIRIFDIHPNPVQSHLTVDIELQEADNATLELYHLQQNRRVLQHSLTNAQTHALLLDLSNEPAGLYILVLRAGNETKSVRIIKL